MTAALPDVNVLIALLDPDHIHHEDAHQWFGAHAGKWAVCPITINGCARVLGNPRYSPHRPLTVRSVLSLLHDFCSSARCEFWPDELSLLDGSLFRHSAIAGPGAITDLCLLALAVRHDGKLVTFDRSISRKAVIGAQPKHLQIPGRA